MSQLDEIWVTFRCGMCKKELWAGEHFVGRTCPYCDTGELVRFYSAGERKQMAEDAAVDAYRDRQALDELCEIHTGINDVCLHQ